MHNISQVLSGIQELVFTSMPQVREMRYDVTWKPDGSPVTAADVFLEKTISDELSRQIPGIRLIGEETWKDGTLGDEEWIAVLDPIDGTENFCSGLEIWGVSLSIWQGRTHRGSMLLMPELNKVLSSGNIDLVPRSRIVGFSSSYHEKIGEGVAENPESRIMGCAVFNLFNVIRGAYARFLNPKGAWNWDLLAGVALAYEAKCDILIDGIPYNGQFLEPGRRYRVDIRHRYDLHPG